uniref:Uncharacterized protein n=1 Tax=Tetranychus urticae TaxID=32264 RepID=T1KSD7_TETUR
MKAKQEEEIVHRDKQHYQNSWNHSNHESMS